MLTKGQVYLFESRDRVGGFVQHRGDQVRVNGIRNGANAPKALFKVVPGLASREALAVSFEPVSLPGHYLAVKDGQAVLQSAANPGFRPERATFNALTRLLGIACGAAFEARSKRGWFLRRRGSGLYLEEARQTDQAFFSQATWDLVKQSRNFAGDDRYVKYSWGLSKLYMSLTALGTDDPEAGFHRENSFADSCGPDAAWNVLEWYGIRKSAHCTPQSLAKDMKTNDWHVAGADMPGTSTPNFVSALRKVMEAYMPSDYQFRYNHSGPAYDYYHDFELILREGNPVVVNHKTGSLGDAILEGESIGHFSVIIGLEATDTQKDNRAYVGDNLVYFANGRDSDGNGAKRITWDEFQRSWKRDYSVFSLEVLSIVDEYPYTNVYVRKSGAGETRTPTGTHGRGDSTRPRRRK